MSTRDNRKHTMKIVEYPQRPKKLRQKGKAIDLRILYYLLWTKCDPTGW
jgi:hypothetical protein